MNIEIISINGVQVGHLLSDNIEINDTQEAVEMMMNFYYQGAESVIIYEKNLPASFFDLKSGLAGDILQKFSTYNLKLAIVGDFEKVQSKSLKDFIYESNKVGRINFLSTLEDAKGKLSGK